MHQPSRATSSVPHICRTCTSSYDAMQPCNHAPALTATELYTRHKHSVCRTCTSSYDASLDTPSRRYGSRSFSRGKICSVQCNDSYERVQRQ